MNARFYTLAIVAALFLASQTTAQNFFWSTSPFGTGAGADSVVNPLINPSGTVYLYYEGGGSDIDSGIQLDFSWSQNGVVGFTAAETFDADITVGAGGPAFSQRWGDFTGPANVVTADEVSNFLAKNVVSGEGIQQSFIPGNGIFVDTLYDTTADSFLIGSFDYEFLGPGIALLQVDGLVVNAGADIGSNFSSLQFGNLPEPSMAGLLTIGLFGFFFKRRR